MALGRGDGKLRWTVKTENYVHGTPAIVDGVGVLRRLRRDFSCGPRARRQQGLRGVGHGVHRRLGRDGRRRRLFRHVRQSGHRVRRQDSQVKWRYEHPERKFPVLLVGGRRCWRGRARRPRSDGACARCGDGQGALDAHDPRAHRLVAGHRGRARLRRLERRPLLRARSRVAARWCGSTRTAAR